MQRLGGGLEHGRDEELEVDVREVALLDPRHGRHLLVRPGHVLGDHAPHPSKRLAPSLGDRSRCLTLGRGRFAHVRFGHASLRPAAGHALQVDAELLCEPANERRRPDTSRRGTSRCLALGRVPFGRRRWRARLCAVLADHDEDRPDRDDLALLDEDLRDLAGGRRRDLDRRLVGLDLDERLVLGDLVALGHEPAGDLAFGQALAEIGKLELVRHGGGIYRGRPIQASAGAMRTRNPPSVRQIETACSSPARRGASSRGTYPSWSVRSSFQIPTAFGSCSFSRLGDEREPPARVERRIVERLGTERDSRRRHDEDPRILPVHDLARRRIPEPVARLGALEQQAQPLAQSSAE